MKISSAWLIALCSLMAAAVVAQQRDPLEQPATSLDYTGVLGMTWDPFGAPPGMTSVKPDMVADGDGVVWAIFSRMGPEITQFQNGRWKDLKLREFSESLNAQKLRSLADGQVACLWCDSARENTWQISRHRGSNHSNWAKFTIKMEHPRMLPLADGGLLITHAGHQVVRISPDGHTVDVLELPEDVFIRPKKNEDGSENDTRSDIHAVQDLHGGIWLWSYGMQSHAYSWRLRGLSKLEARKVVRQKIGDEDGSAPISAVVPWQKDRLAVAVAGVGLFELDLNGPNVKRFEDANGELKYVEKIFHANGAWHCITTPRPTELDISVSKTFSGQLQTSTRRFYDPEKRTSAIMRFEGSKIMPLAWKVDAEPVFGWPDRSVVETPDGFWTCTRGEGLLFVAVDHGQPVLRTFDWRSGLRFREPDLLARSGDHLVVMETSAHKASAVALQPPTAKAGPLRIDLLNTTSLLLEDAQGRVWGRLGDGSMQCWENGCWKKIKVPDKVAAMTGNLFVADDSQQGWLMPLDRGAAAVCDFTTGQWQVFDTLEQALQARLKAGSRLHLQGHDKLAPLSAPGKVHRIGFFRQDGKLHHFDGVKWQVWTLSDFAGPDARVTGAPSFDEAGEFSVPVYQASWKLRESGRWEQTPTAENASITPERAPPPDCPVQGVGSVDYDRFGICWLTDEKGRLWKSIHGRAVPVIELDEPSPAPGGMHFYEVRTDLAGNAFLRLEYGWHGGSHLVVHARGPQPDSAVKLRKVLADTVEISFGKAAWHSWRMDGGAWSQATEKKEHEMAGLLPGEHELEVMAYSADLTPAKASAKLKITIEAANIAELDALIEKLGGDDLDASEAAARRLRSQGTAILPSLKKAREKAGERTRWWLGAVIQQIEAPPLARPVNQPEHYAPLLPPVDVP